MEALRLGSATVAGEGELARTLRAKPDELRDLVRAHYHLRPTDLLWRARTECARRQLISTDRLPAEIAADLGFDSVDQFDQAVKQRWLLSVEAVRALRQGTQFTLDLPPWLLRERLFAYWGRDPKSASERVDGERISWALQLEEGPAVVEAELLSSAARCRIVGSRVGTGTAVEAHWRLLRMLGLDADPRPFEQRLVGTVDERLITGRLGLTVPRTPTIFDALVWVIAGQQVSLAAAFSIRRRLIEHFGDVLPNAGGLIAPPTASRLAASTVDELAGCGLTRNKALALHTLATDLASGHLQLPEHDLQPAEPLRTKLLARRGLGPWSVSYLMMRAYGLADCAPLGDVALQRSLARHYDLDRRPSAAETGQLMERFAPHRSLATFHLWAADGEARAT